MDATSFYTQTGPDVFDSSPLTAGPWSPSAQHAGPPSALLARQLERYQPRPGHRLARVTVSISWLVPVAPLHITVESVHQGKRVELLQATAQADGSTVLIGRAWRLVAASADFPAPPRDQGLRDIATELTAPDAAFPDGWHGDGYLSVIEWRFEHGGFTESGPAKGWTRPTVTLIDGEEMTPWQRVLTVADSGSGISVCAPPDRYPAINCDLSVVLDHDPAGEWIGMESRTTVTPGAGAMTQTIILDQAGPAGLATQTLVA